MELVSQDAALVRVTSTRPFALQDLVVIAVTIAVVVGSAFVWTAPGVRPTEQAGRYLLDPALIQFREGERENEADTIRAGTYGLDSALILLRKGERARLSRWSSGSRRVPYLPLEIGGAEEPDGRRGSPMGGHAR